MGREQGGVAAEVLVVSLPVDCTDLKLERERERLAHGPEGRAREVEGRTRSKADAAEDTR